MMDNFAGTGWAPAVGSSINHQPAGLHGGDTAAAGRRDRTRHGGWKTRRHVDTSRQPAGRYATQTVGSKLDDI